jgi:hypothetical protein
MRAVPADREHLRDPLAWLQSAQAGRTRLTAAVGPDGHFGRQQSHERFQVAAEQRREKLLGDLAAYLRVGPEARTPRLHVLACAVGKLADGSGGTVEDPRNLGRPIAEHLAQHEDRPFQRRQRLQHHQQRHRQRFVADRRFGGVRRGLGTAERFDQRFRQPRPQICLAPTPDRLLGGQRFTDRDPHEVGPGIVDGQRPARRFVAPTQATRPAARLRCRRLSRACCRRSKTTAHGAQ